MAAILLLVCAGTAFAQEETAGTVNSGKRGNFWICPGVETAMFSLSGTAYGGGLSLGYGRRVMIGFKTVYLINTKGLSTLEFNFLFRWYFLKKLGCSCLFAQLAGGPVLFAQNNNAIAVPAQVGTISAGVNAGWRFLLGNRWFIEPVVRAGYPFLVGGGVSGGIRF